MPSARGRFASPASPLATWLLSTVVLSNSLSTVVLSNSLSTVVLSNSLSIVVLSNRLEQGNKESSEKVMHIDRQMLTVREQQRITE